MKQHRLIRSRFVDTTSLATVTGGSEVYLLSRIPGWSLPTDGSKSTSTGSRAEREGADTAQTAVPPS